MCTPTDGASLSQEDMPDELREQRKRDQPKENADKDVGADAEVTLEVPSERAPLGDGALEPSPACLAR